MKLKSIIIIYEQQIFTLTHCGVQGFIAYLSIRLNILKCWQNWVVRNCLLHRDSLNFWRLLKIESACCLRLESELLLILRFLEGGSWHIFLAWIILRSKRYDIFILRREEGLSVEGICLREFNWWAWLLILNWRSNLAEGFLGGTAVSRNAWLLICGIHQLILSWVISGIHLLHLIKLFLYFWAPALDFVLVNYLVYLILIRLGLGRRFKFLILFFCVQSLQGMLLKSFHIKIWGLFHDGLHLTRYLSKYLVYHFQSQVRNKLLCAQKKRFVILLLPSYHTRITQSLPRSKVLFILTSSLPPTAAHMANNQSWAGI